MKPTLLFTLLPLVLSMPQLHAKSDLEILRARCSEQERQIRELEEENAKLKRLVADLSLDKAMLQDVVSRKL